MRHEQASIVLHGLAWLPWLVIFPATVLLWRDRTRPTGLWAIGAGYALASLVGQLSAPVVFPLAALAAAGWAVVNGSSPWIRTAGHGLFILTAVALRLHIAPGFHNPLALDGVVSAGAPPYRAYLNLDKTLSAVWIVAFVPWLDAAGPTLRRAGTGALIGLVSFVALAALGLGVGAVLPDPKLPEMSWLWALNNVILVCFAEEVFFRGYVQAGLARLLHGRRGGEWIAIAAASLLFGFSHVGQGLTMQLLSVVAGLGYGMAYRRAGLIGAITAHATLNIGHFLLLTYPGLA